MYVPVPMRMKRNAPTVIPTTVVTSIVIGFLRCGWPSPSRRCSRTKPSLDGFWAVDNILIIITNFIDNGLPWEDSIHLTFSHLHGQSVEIPPFPHFFLKGFFAGNQKWRDQRVKQMTNRELFSFATSFVRDIWAAQSL